MFFYMLLALDNEGYWIIGFDLNKYTLNLNSTF